MIAEEEIRIIANCRLQGHKPDRRVMFNSEKDKMIYTKVYCSICDFHRLIIKKKRDIRYD